MKDINNVKIIGDYIIELDVDKAIVVTDDEIPCASYPVICSDEELIKQVISKIGYKTTFKASNGNDIEVDEIKEIALFCNFYAEDDETGVWINFNEDKDLIFMGYYSGNLLTNADLLVKIFESWLIIAEKYNYWS